MFAKAFHSMINGIHLALKVNTSFDNSTPAIGSSTESSSKEPGVPTDSHHQHQEENENLHTKNFKAKLERLRSARLTRRNQAVKLLDM
jgi:hypothetical protein